MRRIPLEQGIANFPSTEKLRQLSKQLDWLQYEVDPKWARFCSFGPDDIGGVWEKLGVIRKRPPIAMLLVEKQIMDQLNNDFMKTVFGPIHLGGIPIMKLWEPLANARLIAAAPDLLEACKLLLRCSLPNDVSGREMIRKAWLAVEKATGRDSGIKS